MIKVKYLADVFVEGEPRTAGESYDEHPDTAAQMVRLRRAEVVAGESVKQAKKAKPESAE